MKVWENENNWNGIYLIYLLLHCNFLCLESNESASDKHWKCFINFSFNLKLYYTIKLILILNKYFNLLYYITKQNIITITILCISYGKPMKMLFIFSGSIEAINTLVAVESFSISRISMNTMHFNIVEWVYKIVNNFNYYNPHAFLAIPGILMPRIYLINVSQSFCFSVKLSSN